MKVNKIKPYSIYTRLTELMLLGLAVSAGLFLLLNLISSFLLDQYFSYTNYYEKKDQLCAKSFQRYVKEYHIKSSDSAWMTQWVKQNPVLWLCVYNDGVKIYDSMQPQKDTWEFMAEEQSEWGTYYSVQFEDKICDVMITANYNYRIYDVCFIGDLFFSVIVFLGIILFGIHKRVAYITKLRDEVEILEGGSLDYPITVQGKDELAILAEGLDQMRSSVKMALDRETELLQTNQQIVTELSHDIRTPVTSIMLYTEILRTGKYKSEEQKKEYLDKIDEKARRIKQLTDHLFEYSLVANREAVELEEPESFELLFYDIISETCHYLEQKGFAVRSDILWCDKKVQIHTEYVMRIMDNIMSNLVKYADASYPVLIYSENTDEQIGIVFENRIRLNPSKEDSTGIGLPSMERMMRKMGGSCQVNYMKDKFRVTLLFSCKPMV